MDYCNLIKEHYDGDYPTRQEFLHSSIPQKLIPFPKSFMDYILLNPTSKDGYLKLVKTCKYMFLQNPILLIDSMEHSKYECEGGRIMLEECLNLCKETLIPLNKIAAKFWLYDHLEIRDTDKEKMDLFISKIFRCEIKVLELQSSTLLFEHFKALCSKYVEWAKIGKVKYSDGSEVPIEKLIDLLPNVNYLQHVFRKQVSQETIKKLKKLPQFSRIKELNLTNFRT
uniref:Uncharacterized protein n=1 Tax=Panagrolaimus sp. ES5 TaxID=591445 RepID=A0AC34FTI1_9BILA